MNITTTPTLHLHHTETSTESGMDITLDLVVPEDGRKIYRFATSIPSHITTFTPAKGLIGAWISMNLCAPLGVRTESLAEHNLSNVDFMVTPDAILVAQAYSYLTGLDITTAI